MLDQYDIEEFEAGLKAENDGNSIWTQVSKEGNVWERQVLYDTEVAMLGEILIGGVGEPIPWVQGYKRSAPTMVYEDSLDSWFGDDRPYLAYLNDGFTLEGYDMSGLEPHG